MVMAAASPGQTETVRRRTKKLTTSTKNHTFEPFTRRIARLKIDPVHAIQRRQPNDDGSDLSQSFFGAALDEWTELNLSQTFTSFQSRVGPLCENLPQLLYHADEISGLLVEHIQRKDALALEPLLSLTAHFAHDLDRGFEKHFGSITSLVADVAASHDSPEVIEWCFTCLAWMFKFLSRLLVQDLRPLLHILSPYLKARKQYVARFTAESLAFLLRKAATLYPKQKAPLTLALSDVLKQDSNHEPRSASTQQGVLALLVESCLSIDAGVHSSAPHLMGCLLQLTDQETGEGSLSLVEAVLTGIIHRTNRAGFSSILTAVLDFVEHSTRSRVNSQVQTATQLLRVVVGTRKGSRIEDWARVLGLISVMLETSRDAQDLEAFRNALVVSAMAIQYAPMDQLLPRSESLLHKSTDGVLSRDFFSFCTLVADMGQERFHDLLLPKLQQYIVSRYADDEPGLTYLLQNLHESGTIQGKQHGRDYVRLSSAWEASIVERLGTVGSAEISDELLAGLCRLSVNRYISANVATNSELVKALVRWSQAGLVDTSTTFDLRRRLCCGWVLDACLEITDLNKNAADDLHLEVSSAPDQCFRMVPFLWACQKVSAATITSLPPKSMTRILNILTQNLLSRSASLRKQSLAVMKSIHAGQDETQLRETMDLMLQITEAEYTPSNVREISRLLRKLPQHYRVAPDDALRKTISFFALALLPSYHDQTRKDLCLVLAEMIQDSSLEDTVLDVITAWLRSTPLDDSKPSMPFEERHRLTPFECSNLISIATLEADAFAKYVDASSGLRTLAEEAHTIERDEGPAKARSIALQTLSEMSALAEKRSRIIVPVFLAANFNRTNSEPADFSDSSTSSHTLSPDMGEQGWSLPDRKAFISLVAQFQNPKVLFRSIEVYEKLLSLLSNGNQDIRRLALKAILQWKEPTLIKHEKILNRVVDDKLISADIGVILNEEAEDNPIPSEERPKILPILLRLLYASIIGKSGTYGTQESRRRSILRMLFKMQDSEVDLFLGVALGRLKGANPSVTPECAIDLSIVSTIPLDQQYGMLSMVASLIEAMGDQISPFYKTIIDPILVCTIHASRSTPDTASSPSALARNVKKAGLKCLTMLFEQCPDARWESYMPVIFTQIVEPRLETFVIENAQGVSAILRLVSVWCKDARLASFFTTYHDRLPMAIWQCLSSPNTKLEVKLFIMKDLLEPFAERGAEAGNASSGVVNVLRDQVEGILASLAILLQTAPQKDLLVSSTAVLFNISSLATSKESKDRLLGVMLDLLHQSKQRLPPLMKSRILRAIKNLVDSQGDPVDIVVLTRLRDVVSSLFSYFKDQGSRSLLCDLLDLLSQTDHNLIAAASICGDMNAASEARLEELDFDRRLIAFQAVPSFKAPTNDLYVWHPILHNLLFFIQHDDFSIRSNAASSLKSFVRNVADSPSEGLHGILRDSVIPPLSRSITNDSEIIRAEAVAIYGEVIHALTGDRQLDDMRALLVNNDEEASFFTNILHIQQHRRLRAIRRLMTEAEKQALSTTNVVGFFIPLLQKFLKDDSTDESTQTVRGQSVNAMRALMLCIQWRQFKTLFKQYKMSLDTVEEKISKTPLKLLGHAADALLQARMQRLESSQASGVGISCLAKSLPTDVELAVEVKSRLLPGLIDFIHFKDEAQMSARLPVATVVVKLLSVLPASEAQSIAAPAILDVANVLRSRTQESRDAARKCLSEIAVILGPPSVQFMLRELRNALKRGYQLHVLSYTLHALLVALAPNMKAGDLDYCLADLAAVVMDDIFGAVGQEKENQDYISSMKEVKSNKSFDTMEMLARTSSVDRLHLLIDPIAILLAGHINTKQTRHVDELLRRIGIGLAGNTGAGTRDFLTFAYQTIQGFYREKSAKAAPRSFTVEEQSRQRLLIEKPRNGTVRSTSPLLYKIARFAIDLVRSAFQRHSDLLIPENVHGFLPVIGDALIEAQEDVKISALRLLSAIVKLRMPELDQNAPLYLAEAVKMVQGATNTNEEAAQASLKLVAAMLRERKSVKIRDSDVAAILRRVAPDLEEPDRQGVTFNFVRAVMARKYELIEVYEVADKIGIMMVTNQARGARDVARGVYVHFLADYPQSSARWTKQQKFLIKNLEYEYPEGRESVMEAINNLLTKTAGDTTLQLVSAFFIPIVLRMANDDHESCRDLASALLGQLFLKADQAHQSKLLEPLSSWARESGNRALSKLGMQAFNVLFTVAAESLQAEVTFLLEAIEEVVKEALSESYDEREGTTLQALKLMTKLAEARPVLAMGTRSEGIWASIRQLLRARDNQLQKQAATLVSLFICSCKTYALGQLPLTNIHGLSWSADALRVTLKSSVRMLKSGNASPAPEDEALSLLFQLGRAVELNDISIPIKASPDPESEAALPDSGEDNEAEDGAAPQALRDIPAIQYLLDQCAMILRRELLKLNTTALLPKLSTLQFLISLIPHLAPTSLTPQTRTSLLMPLIHLTSPSSEPPRSADPSFTTSYESLIASAHEVLEVLRAKLGDQIYVKAMTDANKMVRERRDERRRKRVLERVTEPERDAKRRKGKADRMKERKREVREVHRGRRRGW